MSSSNIEILWAYGSFWFGILGIKSKESILLYAKEIFLLSERSCNANSDKWYFIC